MLSPEGLVAVVAALTFLGLLAWHLLVARLEVPGGLEEDEEEEEEEEEGTPILTEDGVGCCRLLCKPSALAQHLERSLGRSAALRGGPWPWPRWPRLRLLQQLLQPPDPAPALVREHLQVPDGGLVALDWLVGPRGGAGSRRRGSGGPPSPVLLLIPNAAGKVPGGLLQLGRRALELGYEPVVFNRRGHNGCPLATPKLQPFGDPGDLREAVAYVRCRHPGAPLLAVSEGSGSGLLLAYLGESGSSSRLAAAACISPVFRARDWFEASLPRLYEWPLLLHLKRGLSRYAGALAEAVDVAKLLGSRSLRELEEALFCGTTGWETYWERNEPLRDADEVAVPVLCVCSADDPVRGPPARTLPRELFRSSPYFFLLLTPRGGHCGFPQRGPGRCWAHEAVLEYFRAIGEFLRAEERRTGVPQPRRWGGPIPEPPAFTWQRSYTR